MGMHPTTTGMAAAGFRSGAVFYYAARLFQAGATIDETNAALHATGGRPLTADQVDYLGACGVHPVPAGQLVLFP